MRFHLGLVSTLLLLSGCTVSPVHYYSLQDGAVASLSLPNSSDARQRVGVGPVSLPKLINRPQLVVRVSGSEVAFEEKHQWGGRLQEELTQLLTQSLQGLHPMEDVYIYPAETRALPARQWSVDIQQLDGVLGGSVQVQAQCRLFDKNTRQTLFERNVALTETMSSQRMDAYVNAQRTLIKRLAQACAW